MDTNSDCQFRLRRKTRRRTCDEGVRRRKRGGEEGERGERGGRGREERGEEEEKKKVW